MKWGDVRQSYPSQWLLVEALTAHSEEGRSVVEEMASTYEEPEEVISWYYGNREQLASVEAVVLEDQVIDSILERATVTEIPCSYEDALRADPPKPVADESHS